MNKIKVSENFSLHEFQCTGAGQIHDHVMLDEKLLELLQKLRTRINKPITINSGYRCPSRNAAVAGSPTSQHLYGKAADIAVPGMSPNAVAAAAEQVGFTGIGTYNTFTHVDVRPAPARWRG